MASDEGPIERHDAGAWIQQAYFIHFTILLLFGDAGFMGWPGGVNVGSSETN